MLLQVANNIGNGTYVKELFDPVQTHAVCGVNINDVDHVKAILKEAGAVRFRVVKNGNFAIVCFKAKK